MSRYKMIVQYDGTQYFGWQKQKNVITIQGILESGLAKLNKDKRVILIGSGRTDTGVHAMGQTVHFDLETERSTDEICKAVNGNCPPDIRVLSIVPVEESFHARYSAVLRHYCYQCMPKSKILYRNQAWLIEDVNLEKLNQAAELILGTHDFTSFSKQNQSLKHYQCQIDQSTWIQKEKMLIYMISGNRFLHHMVRYLVGTMVAIGQNRYKLEDFRQLLDSPKANVHVFKAPPQGLILEKVDYE